MLRGSSTRGLGALVGSRWGALALQVAVGAGSIALLVWRVEVFDALGQLPAVNLAWALPALLLFTASRFLYGYRWRLFMRSDHELPITQLTGIFILANLFNATIPFRAGDVLRIQMTHRRFGVSRSELTSNVMVTETMLDAVAFVTLLMVVLPFLDVPVLSRTEVMVGVGFILVGFLGLLLLAQADSTRDYSKSAILRILPRRLGDAIAGWVPGLLDGLASLREMRRLWSVLAVSVAVRVIEAAVYWMIGMAFGLDLAFLAYVVVMITVGLVVTMPVVLWNIGPYEVAVTEVTALLGATRSVAGAFAIGSHILLIAWMALTGLAAMAILRLRPRDLF